MYLLKGKQNGITFTSFPHKLRLKNHHNNKVVQGKLFLYRNLRTPSWTITWLYMIHQEADPDDSTHQPEHIDGSIHHSTTPPPHDDEDDDDDDDVFG